MDETHWEKIGYVQHDVNGVTEKYGFTHTNPVNGDHYYRIRQVEADGQTTYTTIRMVSITTNSEVALWPNPAKDIVYVSSNTKCITKLFDQYGRQVLAMPTQPGVNILNVQSMPSGTYFVQMLSSTGKVQTRPFIKQ